MGAQAKYLFDVDFAAAADQRPVMTLADHEAKCAEREAKGYAAGMAAAQVLIHSNAQQQIANTIVQIADGIERLAIAMQGVEARLENEAIEVSLAVARKLSPALIEQEPFAEIAALTTECFQHLLSKPHVVVRVNDVSYEIAKKELEEIARGRGFEGRLVVLAEPEIALGDCRVEWAEGGVGRNRAQTEAIIADAVARYVAARIAHPEHEHASPET
jgi:flagellar assembly protein FliH